MFTTWLLAFYCLFDSLFKFVFLILCVRVKAKLHSVYKAKTSGHAIKHHKKFYHLNCYRLRSCDSDENWEPHWPSNRGLRKTLYRKCMFSRNNSRNEFKHNESCLYHSMERINIFKNCKYLTWNP